MIENTPLQTGGHPNMKHAWRSVGPSQTQVEKPVGDNFEVDSCALSC